MQPRLILKQLDRAMDMLQIDLEETKAKKNYQLFNVISNAIASTKNAKHLIEITINDPIDELPTQKEY